MKSQAARFCFLWMPNGTDLDLTKQVELLFQACDSIHKKVSYFYPNNTTSFQKLPWLYNLHIKNQFQENKHWILIL